MDLARIKDLIKLVETSDINGLAVEDGDFKVEIKKNDGQIITSAPLSVTAPVKAPAKEKDLSNVSAIKSPMTGTFYATASPGTPPFVAVGDTVSVGQPVCVVEAMKTFNEIESELSGTIEKILVQSGQPVELGQPLFLVK